jgi:hypothetical protein
MHKQIIEQLAKYVINKISGIFCKAILKETKNTVSTHFIGGSRNIGRKAMGELSIPNFMPGCPQRKRSVVIQKCISHYY